MKYLDEYPRRRGGAEAGGGDRAAVTRPWTIMEVCGGQTHSIVKYGIDELLPPGIELVHGPGCPVCVTPLETDRPGASRSPRGRTSSSARSATCCACPGSRSDLLAAEGARRRRADRLFAARLP